MRVIGAIFALAVLVGCSAEPPQYATGFKEDAFKALPSGATQDQVLRALGEPLDKWAKWNPQGRVSELYWSYSKRKELGAYYYHVVIFTPDGRVKEIDSDFYIE